MISNKKQLQWKLVERDPQRKAIICSDSQLTLPLSCHQGYSGPLCYTRFFFLCPFHRLLVPSLLLTCRAWLSLFPPPPPPTNPCRATAMQHIPLFCKSAHHLACPLCFLSVADYGLVADLFKVSHN